MEIIRSARKSIAIEIKTDLRVVIRAPLHMNTEDILRFAEEKSAWIDAHLQKMRQRGASEPPIRFTAQELEEMTQRAKRIIPERVKYFAPIVGVSYGRVTIRKQVSRWGSCSSAGNLNFNCLLVCAPPEVLDYVVVHELCHRKEMNHSAAFHALVAHVMPDWKERERWLKTDGLLLMRRRIQE